MILTDFKDFPRTGRILGIDWGARRVGLAVSDPTQEFIFTRPQIEYKNELLTEKIINIVGEENVVGIVIGLPIRSNGTESETTLEVRKFATGLSIVSDLPIIFVEENLTSVAAEENLAGKKNKKQKLDSESAKVILENAIALVRRDI
ncbi:MAG: Holliday junction resolvase RuvX [Alphaproteobacteria bacterium]|nr:Holliday junction resolvase RuvX [Alphaproteobacteria bacterium]MBN2675177.1 Holliday junction resolvase RuvX [Alphaproteobacteria bacterium]